MSAESKDTDTVKKSSITGMVISGGHLAAAITGIGALLVAIIVAIVKVGAVYSLVEGIPALAEDVSNLKTDLTLLKQQTSRETLTDIVRSVQITSNEIPAPSSAVAQTSAPTRQVSAPTDPELRRQLQQLLERLSEEEIRSQRIEAMLASSPYDGPGDSSRRMPVGQTIVPLTRPQGAP